MAGLIALAASTSLNAQAAPGSSQRLAHANLTPGLQHAVKLGHSDPNRVLTIAVSLGLQRRTALDAFIGHASDRHSPAYGHYINPAQFASLYGPGASAVQQVADYLRGRGLAVTSISANRTIIDATGPVSAVEAAFGVTIFDWHDPQLNRDFFGTDAQPSLPTSIAPLVVGVMGLNNHYPLRRLGAHDPPLSPTPIAGAYTPVQLKTAYDFTSLGPAQDGRGQALGLFEMDGFNQANVDYYDNYYYGHTMPAVTVHLVDGVSGTPMTTGQIEVELDIEVMHAFAPGASVTVWEGPNSEPGFVVIANAMVTADSTPVNSISWGDCEPQVMASNMTTIDGIFAQAAAQGQTFFASSGDNGPYDCNQDPAPVCCTTNLNVDYPASDPYVTGVGGTSLQLNANNTYKSESAWFNTTPNPPLGSGGGVSTMFSKPAWQAGPGVNKPGINTTNNCFMPTANSLCRQVPDVALDADPNTGISIYTTDRNASAPPTTGWMMLGGTSAAAPGWAALAAIYNQYAANPVTRGGRLGFANPSLYDLASSTEPASPFHDITTGSNPYAAYGPTPAWDYSTGWGSPDAGNLIPELLAINFPLRPWVPVAQAENTGAPPPKPRTGWFSVPRQHAVALNAALGTPAPAATAATATPRDSSPTTSVSLRLAVSVGKGVSTWAAWFVPRAIERLMRFLS